MIIGKKLDYTMIDLIIINIEYIAVNWKPKHLKLGSKIFGEGIPLHCATTRGTCMNKWTIGLLSFQREVAQPPEIALILNPDLGTQQELQIMLLTNKQCTRQDRTSK